MTVTLICKQCHNPFQAHTYNPDRRFCSRACYYAWRKSQQPIVNCQYCGRQFPCQPSKIKGQNFCSRKCLASWRHENWQGADAPQWSQVEVECEVCDKVFAKKPSSPQRFCSYECRYRWQSAQFRGPNSHFWNGGKVMVPCSYCGKELERLRSEVETRSEHFFCSVQCRSKWQSENIRGENHPNWEGNHLETVCAQCGAALSIPAWQAKRGERSFCNYECMGQWSSDNLRGDKRYNWKGGISNDYGPNWSKQKTKARKRDQYRCQHCGKQQAKRSRYLHVHHIRPFRDFGYIRGENTNYLAANHLSNLISLCPSCHGKAEAGTIAVQPYLPMEV